MSQVTRNIAYLALGLVLGGLAAIAFANPIDTNCPQHVTWGAPQVAQEGNNQYLCRAGYAVNYNYTTKVAYFVVETINPQNLTVKSAARRDDFREDPEIPTAYRTTLKDYVGSGLDRGHMAPAANFVYHAQAMSESFLLSNMMPQVPGNNRGIWKYTEELTRFWAQQYGQIYVITGTIIDSNSPVMGNNVRVPTYLYKIVIDPQRSRAIAFLFPNQKLDPKQLTNYIVSIAEIEQYSGINFNPLLPPNLQVLEQQRANLSEW